MIVKVKGGLCPIFSYSGAGTQMWTAVELKGVGGVKSVESVENVEYIFFAF